MENIYGSLNFIFKHFDGKSFTLDSYSETNNISNVNIDALKEKVIKAARNHKIFTLYDGFPEIRSALVKRGWVEKCAPTYMANIHKLSEEEIMGFARHGNVYERVALSKLAQKYNANFIWQSIWPDEEIKQKDREKPYRNFILRSERLNFTTKLGLINCIENAHWHTVEGLSEIQAPRTHIITNYEHLDFLRDYRSTYCCSLLKYIAYGTPIEIFSKTGDLPLKTVEFAMKRIYKEIAFRSKTEINVSAKKNPFGDEHKNDKEWSKFYSSVNMLLEKLIKIKAKDSDMENFICLKCKDLLEKCKKFWPLLVSEGYNNLWILKPGGSKGGQGICIKNKYYDIVNFVNRRPDQKYIVQKYIEQPLLLFKTKFDIRQHILLTIDMDKLNIWMYQDCYLRFCSQEYDLNNLNESLHITNNTVQQKYKNVLKNPNLPDENMWQLEDFQKYLKSLKRSEIWEHKIYQNMKKNIIGVVMASLEETEFIENTFELYGCDFMLDQNFEPILIEINSLPAMTGTTNVTAKVCPAVLKDLIRVVVDLPENPDSNTGKFELISSLDFQTEFYYFGYNQEFDIIGQSVKNSSKSGNKKTLPLLSFQPSEQMIKNPNIKSEPLPSYLRNYRKNKKEKTEKLEV